MTEVVQAWDGGPGRADAAVARLDRVEHIVVVMLKNRSFDHMLGYLSLPGELGGKGRATIDGLRGPAENVNDYNGRAYPIHHLAQTAFAGEAEDPDHSGRSVDEQLADGCQGFVANTRRGVVRRNPLPCVLVERASANAWHGVSEDRVADRHPVLAVDEQRDVLSGFWLGVHDVLQGLARRLLVLKGLDQVAGAVEDHVVHSSRLRVWRAAPPAWHPPGDRHVRGSTTRSLGVAAAAAG